MRAGGALRWARACVLSFAVLAVSVVAHVTAGGLLPGLTAVVLVGAMTTVVCAALLGRPASRARIVAMLVGGQAAVHAVLTATAGHLHDATAPIVERVGAAGSQHGLAAPNTLADSLGMNELMAAAPAHGAATPEWVAHLLADASLQNLPMMLSHMVAAAVVGWWLAAGERLVWSLVSLAARPLARTVGQLVAVLRLAGTSVAAAVDVHLLLRRRRTSDVWSATSRTVRLTVSRRGPPLTV